MTEAHALEADCASKLGDCSVSNAPQDSLSCECTDGSGVGGGGGNEWAGLNQAELDAICDQQLMAFCGPPMPPDGIPCENELGACFVDNEPDSLFCECTNGGGGGGGGGNEWDGLSDDELSAVCFEELDVFCGGDPPDPDWMCETKFGGCSITFEEDPFVACGCAGGGGGGGPGEPEWGGLGEDELLEVCLEQIAEFCGGPGPTSDTDSESTGSAEESSSTDGETAETGGSEEGETTDGETAETTAAEGESSESGSASASASATDSDSASATDSDSASASATDSASASASNTAGEDSSSGSDGGAVDPDPSGCSCNASNDEPPLALGLGLIGLVGWRIRGRRHA